MTIEFSALLLSKRFKDFESATQVSLYPITANQTGSSQNSKYPPPGVVWRTPSVPVAGSRPSTPLKLSQAARFRAGSEPTRSRIISQAAMLRAPSGGGPMAKETEHWGQNEMRCAVDFCRGLIPTVWANMYRATDLWPGSSTRLQRRQSIFSNNVLLEFLTAAQSAK